MGIIALTLGGLLGGWVNPRARVQGLKKVLWPLVLCMHATNAVFVALAIWPPTSLWWAMAAIASEQFGDGFGPTACMVFMPMLAGGSNDPRRAKAEDGGSLHKTA